MYYGTRKETTTCTYIPFWNVGWIYYINTNSFIKLNQMNNSNLLQWAKATDDNIPDSMQPFPVRTDKDHYDLCDTQELDWKIKMYPNSLIEILVTIPSEAKEVKESAEQVLNRHVDEGLNDMEDRYANNIPGDTLSLKEGILNAMEEYALQYQPVPFTEALKKGIPFGESVPVDFHQFVIDQINQSYNEHTGTNEGVQDAAYYIAEKHKEILAKLNQSVPVSDDLESQNTILESQLIIANQRIEQLESEEEKNV